ncbi:MAG TPA: hypothetical protein VH092_22980 [Urbifossiella sp.]|jgi:hypothetical protein|nr:hypothetical protein [Urbifossiella sp.]
MTVLRAFNHEHNAAEVARQEYEFAKQHFREVCAFRDPTNPDHQQRFRDAADRQEEARERWLRVLVNG